MHFVPPSLVNVRGSRNDANKGIFCNLQILASYAHSHLRGHLRIPPSWLEIRSQIDFDVVITKLIFYNNAVQVCFEILHLKIADISQTW